MGECESFDINTRTDEQPEVQFEMRSHRMITILYQTKIVSFFKN